MNIFNLFLKTNILVQISILILIIFSILSWSIIFHRIFIIKIAEKKSKIFRKKFWSEINLSSLYQTTITHQNTLNGIEHIFYTGFKEFSTLYPMKICSPEVIMTRTLDTMRTTVNIELKTLENNIPLIGTIGSISPYFGLFGTILGIMHIFIELGSISNNTSNQIVHIQIIAPGISEALISTAIGLFVAIPAVMAFNYLTTKINNLEQNYDNFIQEFITMLYHQFFFNTKITQNQEYIHAETKYQK
ncbi:protein TolQ [Candidatus Blochmannia ocreatus (nom. nud.)]|uniref:Protein TolQ n=1 Tax=Candidatus Blochmannia ocreatus (nom. nud.) TaxID=251538 RepID=A0ABY4SWN0_9ENTR|nr:protein TolQ [Candidatus Blochmannia ocreatus]URJ25395.1 protein TolQ [Candidatus Blochmannia ocreatus]